VVDPQQRPLSALPSRAARIAAFVAIVLAGAVGGVIGWAFTTLQGGGEIAASIGAAVVAVLAALGTAVVSVLVLRAMGEWRPEG
jgi:cation transporter-like permease